MQYKPLFKTAKSAPCSYWDVMESGSDSTVSKSAITPEQLMILTKKFAEIEQLYNKIKRERDLMRALKIINQEFKN